MREDSQHSRRDFLQGKAAAKTLADRAYELAQQWVGSATELIANRFPVSPTLHVEATRRAMACDFAVRYHETDRHLAGDMLDAFDLIESIEDQLTIYRPTSDVVVINQEASTRQVVVEPEILSLLELVAKLHRETNGAFDITGTPLSRAWGFLKREGHLPNDAEISEALSRVGMSNVELNRAEQTVRFRQDGVEINFNALGKGYALDRVVQLLGDRGATDYLWHGGRSSVLACGVNQGDDQNCWSIGLRNPLKPEQRLAEFHLRNRALGTSGGATQFFAHKGNRFSHILDPRTGWPAEGVFTATVLAPSAAEADALSTGAFVLGPPGVKALCTQRPDVGVVLVCPADDEFGITVVAGNVTREDWTPLCDERMITHV